MEYLLVDCILKDFSEALKSSIEISQTKGFLEEVKGIDMHEELVKQKFVLTCTICIVISQ